MRIAVRGKRKLRTWWLLALAICAFVWWYRGGTFPDLAPDWGRREAPVADRPVYRLAGGYPAAASLDVFQRMGALSQGENNEEIQGFKQKGLVWETTEGQKVVLLSQRGPFKEVQVQEVGSGKSYWTYVDALEK